MHKQNLKTMVHTIHDLHLHRLNAVSYGDEYESKWFPELAERVGKAYLDTENQHFSHKPIPTCLRNHA
jgi:adenylylsulfate reductase subunit A